MSASERAPYGKTHVTVSAHVQTAGVSIGHAGTWEISHHMFTQSARKAEDQRCNDGLSSMHCRLT